MKSARSFIFVLILASAIASAGVLMLGERSHAVAACSMVSMPNPAERLSFALDKWTELVLVGVVLNEARVEPDYSTKEPTDLKPSRDQSTDDEHAIYRSTIGIEAVLKGISPGIEVELPWLSEVWQCIGGPRLLVGDRVLLLLKQVPTWSNPSGPQGFIWQTSLLGGQILFRDGAAFLDDYQAEGKPQYLGPDAEIIKYIAEAVDAPPHALDTALAAATNPIPATDGGIEWSAALFITVIISSVIVLGLAVAFVRHKLRTAA